MEVFSLVDNNSNGFATDLFKNSILTFHEINNVSRKCNRIKAFSVRSQYLIVWKFSCTVSPLFYGVHEVTNGKWIRFIVLSSKTCAILYKLLHGKMPRTE